MSKTPRRHFLKLGAAAALLPAIPAQGLAWRGPVPAGTPPEPLVDFTSDGLGLPPEAYVRLLSTILEERGIKPDSYAQGGCVEELETLFATLLGKERAVFLPTGTLANHLALRALADGGRVLVQHESHIYNDTGDAAQRLSGLNVVPLAPGKATFTVADLEEAIARTASGRGGGRVGAISLETPVRRRSGERFDEEELERVVRFARGAGLPLHLDGARLFLAPAWSGIAPAKYAEGFDTVYVSLYKYFNAGAGAILAGPESLIAPLRDTRRMFGGGVYQAWPYAAVALYYAEGFAERFARAVRVSEELIARLSAHGRFEVQRVPNGTNIFRLRVEGMPAQDLAKNLLASGVRVRPPAKDGDILTLQVNETAGWSSADELERAFIGGLR